MENKVPIQSFMDLEVWQVSHSLILAIYASTRDFPREEQFGLTSQLRRAVVSITSNIAEGFSRRGFREKLQFYYMALGSLTEVHNQLLIASDLVYLGRPTFDSIILQITSVHKLLNAFISSTKNYLPDAKF